MPTWDDRIDEAARQLTEGQPNDAFRTRVLARLTERPRRWAPMWLLAPAAAAAIVVLAIVMPREELNGVPVKIERPAVDAEVRLKPNATPDHVGLKAPDPVGLKPDTTPAVPLQT